MHRRAFLAAMTAVTAALGLSSGAASAAESTRERPWRVRLDGPRRPCFTASRVLDVRTGADVSTRFPIRCAHRLERSHVTGKPVRVALFRLDERGSPFLVSPDRIATEPAWVLVS